MERMIFITFAFFFLMNNAFGNTDDINDGICDISLLNIVPDSQLTASSSWSETHGPWRARLNSTYHIRGGEQMRGCWAAATNDQFQYIEVEFANITEVLAVVTRARDNSDGYNQYVTSYRVLYSKNCMIYKTVENEDGSDVIFVGNTDTTNIVTNRFSTPLEAKCIRINPLSWYGHVSLRFDLVGCPGTCVSQLLSTVQDFQLTASSSWSETHGPWRARLNSTYHIADGEMIRGCWAAETNDKHQYIQVELNEISDVRGIVTKARDNADGYDQYVTSYGVSYSMDCVIWRTIDNFDGIDTIFVGNTDTENYKTNWLTSTLIAKCVRINPLSWYGHVSLRFDLLGCSARRCSFQ
ncbi:lactadherin-like [Mya arenaria]|uniref:lactadherin-like n=1 Tax=Mya arenaria TaxID=6604 RepID=UPI0022DFFC98|nr:lactadherin-like [Mya arenaria]